MYMNCFSHSLNTTFLLGQGHRKSKPNLIAARRWEKSNIISLSLSPSLCLISFSKYFWKGRVHYGSTMCQSKHANDIYIYTKQKAWNTKREVAEDEVYTYFKPAGPESHLKQTTKQTRDRLKRERYDSTYESGPECDK